MAKVIGIIPARYRSSRFPGKALANILGKPLMIHVAEKVEQALGKQNVIIATDDKRIKSKAEEYGFHAVMTSDQCVTGTDRLWEVAQQIKANIYINVQGDEPMVKAEDIQKIIDSKISHPNYVINGMCTIGPDEDPKNINIPKVLVNKSNELIYMSRLPIPGVKSSSPSLEPPEYKKQVCIYAFNYEELKSYGEMGVKTIYENYEDIEILRFFDLNKKIKMVETSGASLAVDVPEDVELVENHLKNLNESGI